MKIRVTIRKEVKTLAIVAMISFLIAFTERNQAGEVITKIMVDLENVNDNHFVDQADVVRIIEDGQAIAGRRPDEVDLRMLEGKLRKNKHIEEAELYVDVKGNLMARVKLRRPIARLVQAGGNDAYVSQDGVVMPISEKFSSRVLLVSGATVPTMITSGNILDLESGRLLMEMLTFIHSDPFWKAQVAQLHLTQSGEVLIYPQVTGQLVEFGKPEQIGSKFRKLKIFYKEILPQRGWTKYERVNVAYEGQVIAQ